MNIHGLPSKPIGAKRADLSPDYTLSALNDLWEIDKSVTDSSCVSLGDIYNCTW